MKNTHTPGPWKIVKVTPPADKPHLPTIYPILTADGKELVCDPQPKNGEANARLIAAAPELLVALETLLDYAQSCRDVIKQTQFKTLLDCGQDAAPIIEARMAIVAAKGTP